MPVYIFNTFEDPSASPGTTEAFGVNDTDQIVGQYDIGTVMHGFLENGGTYTTLDDPSASPQGLGTVAQGINAAALIVGYYYDNANAVHRFLSNPNGGSYTTLDDPLALLGLGQGTLALGINDKGQIVGGYYSGHFNGLLTVTVSHGFLLSGGSYTTLDDP